MRSRQRAAGIAAFTLCVFLWSTAFACQQYHTAVALEHNFERTVAAAQQIEINEHTAGHISDASHKQFETIFLKIAQGGEQAASLMLKNADKQTVLTQLDQIAESLSTLLSEGTLGIKNETTLGNFKAGILAAQDILKNLRTFIQ